MTYCLLLLVLLLMLYVVLVTELCIVELSNDPPLTDTEKEEFFWAKLVNYGWKLGQYSYGNEEHVSLILCCQECDHIFEDFKTLTYEQARLISAEWYAERMMKHHDCKAISEAIPKDY